MSPVSRREFLAIGAAAGAGLVIEFYLPHGRAFAASQEPFTPNAYLKIAPDGSVTVVVPRSEMGQGVRTALPMILAEELDADWTKINIDQAGADDRFGDETTGASASVRTTWDPMRKAGAAAREMLIAAAATQWKVEPGACSTEKGYVVHAASNRRAGYGNLAEAAASLPVPQEPKLKKPADFAIIGKPLPRLDTPSKVNGSAKYGIDVRLPGMTYALLARCPVVGGKVASVDDSAAKKVPGVTAVAKIGDAAVAVVADRVWSAMEGRRALKVTWDEGPNAKLDSAAISESLRQGAAKTGEPFFTVGDVAKAQGRKIDATYELPFLAHAPMEPGNTTASCTADGCEIWSPTQVPQDCRDSAAAALGMKGEQVKVNVTLLGGGFGRRLEHDYAVEAALVSKAIGAPVQVLWTREDDMQNSPYRPVSYHALSAMLDTQGWPVAFSHKLVGASITAQKGQPFDHGMDPDLEDNAALLYPIPNIRLERVQVDTPVPLAWLRSVYAQQMAFASESFIDELAAAAHRDPLEYRLHLLAEDREIKFYNTTWQTARVRGVLKLAAEKAGWERPLPKGLHRGIAAFGAYGTYAAEVVEISMQGTTPKVRRVVAAIDCGRVVNPHILEQQIHSAVIFGLSSALHLKITFANGRVEQSNFDDYSPLRMSEAPQIEAHFVPSEEDPTGAGEPPVPPLAPALCNAIFAATGKRIRKLPLLGA